jgi:site-specific DNA recombinase
MPKYVLYARKSTDIEDRQVLSIESQINELREYAKKESLFVVDEFSEAKSAKCTGRPIFEFVLQQLESGNADGILAWHPDRLARNSLDGGKIIYLIDRGIINDLRFPTYRFDNTAQGKFMLSIAFGQSKYYIDNLSENIRRGMREKLRRGVWPIYAPLGYVNDRKNRVIIPDSERAPYIKKIFEVYATANFSLYELMQEVKTWGLIGRKGKPVHKSKLARLLQNPFYYGVIRFNGEMYEGSHPPLISKKLFDRCQEVLSQKSKPQKRGEVKFAFRGFIKCGECGGSITAEMQKGHIYYRCTKKIRRCRQKFLREEALLEQINKSLLQVFIPDNGKDIIFNRLDELAEIDRKASFSLSHQLQDRIQGLDAKIERLIDLYVERDISQEEYQHKKAKLVNEKKDLQERLGEIEKQSGGWLELSKNFITSCNLAGSVAWQGNLSQKRDFLKTNGSNHTLKDKNLSFYWSEPFNMVAKIARSQKWRRGRDSNPRWV